MHWKFKAFIQNTISLLPEQISYEVYYGIQRKFGGLRRFDPSRKIADAVKIVNNIEEQNKSVDDKLFLEVGTGRALVVPIMLWLCGAGKIITVDMNPYLKTELIKERIDFIRNNRSLVMELVGGRANEKVFQQRFKMLENTKIRVEEFMKESQIEYLAPADARILPIEANSIDYHISNNTLEHIPADDIKQILTEAKRTLKDDGLLVHIVDFADHFSHSDPRISKVNFLQYTEKQWLRYAGNRYMYHNRLRIDEIEKIIKDSGLQIVTKKATLDQNALRVIENGLKLSERFAGKPKEINSIVNALVVAGKTDKTFVTSAPAQETDLAVSYVDSAMTDRSRRYPARRAEA